MDDKEPFFLRWSRRKLETKKDGPAGAAKAAESVGVPAAPPPAPATEPPAPELPQRGSPEYREYFDPQVEESLRRLALKTLFSEPQFNIMDGLDTYVDDYSKPDPIPAAMLRRMHQAKDLFLFEDENKPEDDARDATRELETPAPASGATPAVMSTLENPAAAPEPGADAAPGPAATPPPNDRRNN